MILWAYYQFLKNKGQGVIVEVLAEKCALVCFHILAERGVLGEYLETKRVGGETLHTSSPIDHHRYDLCPLRGMAGRNQNV